MAAEAFPPVSKDVLREEHERYFTFFHLSLLLIGLTFVELIIVVLPFQNLFLTSVLIILSLMKFLGVIWYFMHLKWDKIFLTTLFMIGLLLATGTVGALMLIFEEHKENLQIVDQE